MPARKTAVIRTLRIKKSDDLKTIYKKVRRSFTAADLQKYTETEEMYPTEKLLAELETIHQEESRKRKVKKA
jgi:hypothetical protein